MEKKFKSLRTRFSVSFVFVISLIVILFSSVAIIYNSNQLDKQLLARSAALLQLSQKSLASALWQYNFDYINDYADSLMGSEEVVLVRVLAEDKLIVNKTTSEYSAWEIDDFQSDSDFITKQADVENQGVIVGKVILILSRDVISRVLYTNTILLVSLLGLLVPTITLINHRLSKKYLFRPLGDLEKSARAIADGQLETQIQVTSNDEIGQLGRTFQQMMQSIKLLTTSRDELNQEIAERKKTEEILFESNAILKAAMDCSPAGIAIADSPDGKLRYVNDAGLLIRGADRESIVNGIGIEQYVSNWKLLDLDGQPLKTDDIPLVRALRHGESSSREFIIRRNENEDRIVFANAAPILNKAGGVTAAIVVFLDITDRKQVENELRQHRDNLDDLVEERTVQLRKTLKLMTGREVRMADLKKSIKKLQGQLIKAGIEPIIKNP